ncbi:hypothetical protein [Stomatobaculum longum]|uniref:hypothetical protein n=1 Tax=Stomatobaculum longum TaxID=796942 RepID=UPI0028DB0C4F|nr:hypothetical protein [Stomatobaculum longum]
MSRKDFVDLLRFLLRVALLFWQTVVASVMLAVLIYAPIVLIRWIWSMAAGV